MHLQKLAFLTGVPTGQEIDEYTVDMHDFSSQSKDFICVSAKPAACSVVATPIRKLWISNCSAVSGFSISSIPYDYVGAH